MIETTYGRIMFNMILPQGMDFYNIPLRSAELATVISDCYQRLGRRATIDLLDDMNQLGLPREHAQRSVVRHRRPGDAIDQEQAHHRTPTRRC